MNSLSKMELTLDELAFLESEMLKKKKNKEAAWGLWAGLSFFGAHRFYTENYLYASAMLLTSLIPIFFIIFILSTMDYYYGLHKHFLNLFIFLLVGSVVWSWIDAFFLNKRIDQLNEEVESNILHVIAKQQNSRKAN